MFFFFEFLDYYTFVMIWRKKNLLDKTKWDLCWCGFGNELKLLLLLIMHFWHIVVARKRSTNERSFLHSSSTHHWPLKSPGPTANVIPSQDDEISKKNHWYRSGILFTTLPIYLHSILHSTYRSRKKSHQQTRIEGIIQTYSSQKETKGCVLWIFVININKSLWTNISAVAVDKDTFWRIYESQKKKGFSIFLNLIPIINSIQIHNIVCQDFVLWEIENCFNRLPTSYLNNGKLGFDNCWNSCTFCCTLHIRVCVLVLV